MEIYPEKNLANWKNPIPGIKQWLLVPVSFVSHPSKASIRICQPSR